MEVGRTGLSISPVLSPPSSRKSALPSCTMVTSTGADGTEEMMQPTLSDLPDVHLTLSTSYLIYILKLWCGRHKKVRLSVPNR